MSSEAKHMWRRNESAVGHWQEGGELERGREGGREREGEREREREGGWDMIPA